MGEAITRHSLRPLISEGDGYCKTRADPAAGMRSHVPGLNLSIAAVTKNSQEIGLSKPRTITSACALPLAAMLALASPAQAEPNSCGTAAARDIMAYTLRRAGDERPVNITFRTRADGVKMPTWLLEQYPDEITIILQYEFTRLAIGDERFEVTVWFKGRPARLAVPFDAVKSFYDNNVAKCWGR